MSLPNNYQCAGQMSIEDLFGPDSWCGRTFPVPLVQTKEKTSERCLKKLAELRIKPPQYLCLVGGASGQPLDVSWEMGGPLLGEYTMRSFGEFPNEENESTLSQILQANVPQRYYLSPMACLGILRRASDRGKELPMVLRVALERQASCA